jgi:hypothetical protein
MGTLVERRSRKLKSTTRPAADVSAKTSSSKEQGSQHEKPDNSRVPDAVVTPPNFATPQHHGDRHDRDSDDGDDDPADDVLLRAPAVRKRYGNASDMWLHRRLHDDSGFPKPIFIGPVRYWRLSNLLVWEKQQAEQVPVPQPRALEYIDRARAALAAKRAEQRRKDDAEREAGR